MIHTTREQRETLKRKCDAQNVSRSAVGWELILYRDFRRSVQGLIGGNGCIMVPWCGMWLGIETDGIAGS